MSTIHSNNVYNYFSALNNAQSTAQLTIAASSYLDEPLQNQKQSIFKEFASLPERFEADFIDKIRMHSANGGDFNFQVTDNFQSENTSYPFLIALIRRLGFLIFNNPSKNGGDFDKYLQNASTLNKDLDAVSKFYESNIRNLVTVIDCVINSTTVDLYKRVKIKNLTLLGKDDALFSPLDLSIEFSLESIAVKIVNKGISGNLPANLPERSSPSHPIIRATAKSMGTLTEQLLKQNTNVFASDSEGNGFTAIAYAAGSFGPSTIERMHKLAINQISFHLSSLALSFIPVPLNQLIADYAWSTDFFSPRDHNLQTPLHAMMTLFTKITDKNVRNRMVLTLQKILELGGSELCNMKDIVGDTPLTLAAEHSLKDIIPILLKAGADKSLIDMQN